MSAERKKKMGIKREIGKENVCGEKEMRIEKESKKE